MPAPADPVRAACLLLALAAPACARPAPPAPYAPPAPLPALPVADPGPPPVVLPAPDTFGLPPGPPVTLTAASADLRALLPALAEAAGVSLVVGPEVQGRASIHLVDVPARDALLQVLAAAGLSLAAGPGAVPVPPVVFRAVPVDVEEAGVELIMARFGVGREAAEWIVATRRAR